MDIRQTTISILMLLTMLLFLTNILNSTGQIIHPTQNRITYYIQFSYHITGSTIDDFVLTYLTGIALFLLTRAPKIIVGVYAPAIILLFFASTNELVMAHAATGLALFILGTFFLLGKLKRLLIPSYRNFTIIFLVSWLCIEVLAFFSFALFAGRPRMLGAISLGPYEWLFSGLSIINPVLAAIFIFSFLIRNFRAIRPWQLDSYSLLNHSLFSNKISLIMILAPLILTLFFMQMPHSLTLNPDQKYVSTDEHDYLQRLEKLDNTESSAVPREIFVANGERPLFVLFLYGIKFLFPYLSNLEVLRLIPYMIWPGFVASAYFVTLKLTTNRDIAVLSAMFTSMSSQPLVMIYGGFFANFVALSIAYLIFLCIWKIWKYGPNVIMVISTVALIAVLLFTHVYTWTWFLGILIIFGIISAVAERKTRERKLLLGKIVAIAAIILASVMIDYVKVTTLGSVGGLERDITIAGESISYQQFYLRWNNLAYTFSTYLGGFLMSVVFLVIAVYWSLKFKHDTILDRILLSTVYLLSFIFMFGDYVLQTRLFLNIPIGIIIGLVIYSKVLQSKYLSRKIATLMVVTIVIFSVHYLFVSFYNLVLPL